MRWKVAVITLAATAAGLAVGGCGTAAPGGRGPKSPEPAVAAGGRAVPAVAPTRPAAPIATVVGSELEARLDLLSVRRTGPKVVTAQFRLRVPASAGYLGLHTSHLSDDGAENDVSGARLVDEVHGRQHLPLRDVTGECLCSRELEALIGARESVDLSAKFPAPPPDVHAVSVQLPTFPSFDQVPLG